MFSSFDRPELRRSSSFFLDLNQVETLADGNAATAFHFVLVDENLVSLRTGENHRFPYTAGSFKVHGETDGANDIFHPLGIHFTDGVHDDEKGEEQRNEVGVGHEPSFVVDMLFMFFLFHKILLFCFFLLFREENLKLFFDDFRVVSGLESQQAFGNDRIGNHFFRHASF